VFALIGLGNPGRRYENTRHNIGYLIIDHFASMDKIPFKAGKGDYYYKDMNVEGSRILVAKPTSYMNNSGLVTKQILDYFPLSVSDLLIVCDDFNLPFGTIRYRPNGTDGGHNGLKSIIYHLHTDDFNRFRFGIGTEFSDAASYVLDKFSKNELTQLKTLLPISTNGIKMWIKHGIESTMNNFNRQFIKEDD
jgi:PTH1 family peptidyl-tRNA hydrolase